MKLLGLSCFNYEGKSQLNKSYTESFTLPGFAPLIIPIIKTGSTEIASEVSVEELKNYCNEYASKLDGLVLTGGGDINSLTFDKKNVASWNCNSNRDRMEVALLEAFIDAQKPIFGICRGMQLIGQYFGLQGFQQDINNCEEWHDGTKLEVSGRSEPVHSIYLRGSLLEYMHSKGLPSNSNTINVNSFHHQAFSLNKDLKKCSYEKLEAAFNALDLAQEQPFSILAHTNYIIEGLKHKELPILGVQWHPEEVQNSLFIKYFLDTYFKV